MRLPRLYRRAPRGWADVKRELEAAGVPRVGGEPNGQAIDAHDLRSALSVRSRRPQGDAMAHMSCEPTIDEEAIEQAARRLWEVTPPGTRIVVFGSYAWARAGAHSDLDLLVIEPGRVESPAIEAVRLRRALRGMLLPAEILVISEGSAQEWRAVSNSLIGAALAEGRELTQ
jgi:predicted nucleotidyltransferase